MRWLDKGIFALRDQAASLKSSGSVAIFAARWRAWSRVNKRRSGLFEKIDAAQGLSIIILHDKAAILFCNSPRLWKAVIG